MKSQFGLQVRFRHLFPGINIAKDVDFWVAYSISSLFECVILTTGLGQKPNFLFLLHLIVIAMMVK